MYKLIPWWENMIMLQTTPGFLKTQELCKQMLNQPINIKIQPGPTSSKVQSRVF